MPGHNDRSRWQSRLPSRSFFSFVDFTLRQPGHRSLLALVFLILGSLSEGVSVLLLVPILQLLGPDRATVAIGVPTSSLRQLFGSQLRIGLFTALLIMVVAVTLRAVFMQRKNVYLADLIYKIVNNLRTSVFSSVCRARWRFVSSMRGADLLHALTGDVERIQQAALHLLLTVQNGILLATYLFISLTISPTMTAVSFASGVLVLGVLHPVRRRASAYGQLVTQSRQQQYRTVSEFLSGLKVAKSFGAEPQYLRELEVTLRQMHLDFRKYLRASSIGAVLIQTANAIVLGAFVYIALDWLFLPLPKIVVLIFVFLRAVPSVGGNS